MNSALLCVRSSDVQFGIRAPVQYLLRAMGLFVHFKVGYCPIISSLPKSDQVSWEIAVIAPLMPAAI